jgi:hypothetical protein
MPPTCRPAQLHLGPAPRAPATAHPGATEGEQRSLDDPQVQLF